MDGQDQDVLMVRRSSLFALRGTFVVLVLALVADLVGLAMGLSEEGWGWAFNMPQVALSGLVGLTASVGGLILGVLRLTQRRGKDVPIWFGLVALLATGLGGLLLIFVSIATSASV